jgi:hypothetical protein
LIGNEIATVREDRRSERPLTVVINLGLFKFISVIALLAVLPFQNTLNLVLGTSIRPLTLGLLVVLFLDGLRLLVKRNHKFNFFEQMALLWIGFALLYIPVTMFAIGSIPKGFEAGIFGFMVQYQGFMAYFIIRSMRLSNRQSVRILKVMFITLTIVVGYGFFEYFWGQYKLLNWLIENSRHPYILEGEYGYFRQRVGAGFYRSQSFILEFVTFGYFGYVLSSILFAVVALSRKARKKKLLWVALTLAVLGLLSSITLSGIAILVLTAGVVGWETLRRRGMAKYAFLLIPIFVVISFLLFIISQPAVVETIEDQLSQQKSIYDRLVVHLEYNVAYLNEIPLETMLLGRGMGTSGPGSRRYFPREQYDFFIENEYLGNVAETGLISFFLYLLLIFALVRYILIIKRQFPWGSHGYALGVGLFCVTLGYILIGFSHNVWGQATIDVQFMMLLALWAQNKTLFGSNQA